MAYPNGYSYRATVTVDNANVPADVTDFPVLISGTWADLAHTDHGGKATDVNGYDIVFSSDEDGATPLYWEIESYNHETGAIKFWVKSSLDSAADTVFYCFVGNALISTFQSTATSAWDGDFRAVYHFIDGVTLNLDDATANNYDLTNSNAEAGAGKIDGGIVTASSKYANSPAVATTTSVTISYWLKTTASGNYQMGFSAVNANQYELRLNDTNYGHLTFGYSGGSGTEEVTESVSLSDGAWHHIVGTWDAGGDQKVRLYRDGVLRTTGATLTNYPSPFTSFRVGGREGDNSYPFIGTIDELRLSSVARSSDWIATEYSNQSDPGTFLAIGTFVASAAGNPMYAYAQQ